MLDEGYIKFNADWEKAPPFPREAIAPLNACRQRLYELGLIGAYDNGIGYGNISCRRGQGSQFFISGSKTGNFQQLGARHYALVTDVQPAENRLHCRGPIIASSESMSHAIIYEECPWAKAVIHVHHLGMWQRLLHQVPTTDAAAPYGSPAMVESIRQLMRETNLPQLQIFVMEGHKEGIFTFGKTLESAMQILLHYFEEED